MRDQQVFSKGGIRHRAAVESFSLVPNRDCDFSVHVAAARDVNTLARVITITVNHGICQGFTQGHFDVGFTSIRHPKVQNEPRELFSEWRDGPNFTWE